MSAKKPPIPPSRAADDALSRYGDIINLPHPTSRTHPRMPKANRAAQFAPFAALAGYAEAIEQATQDSQRG